MSDWSAYSEDAQRAYEVTNLLRDYYILEGVIDIANPGEREEIRSDNSED